MMTLFKGEQAVSPAMSLGAAILAKCVCAFNPLSYVAANTEFRREIKTLFCKVQTVPPTAVWQNVYEYDTYHYIDVIVSAMASQITGDSIVCSTVCSGADQRKHQSSASLAFVRGMHQWPVNSLHTGSVTRKIFPFHDDVIKWKLFQRYWPFVRGIHRSPVNYPHKGQWRGALMFSLIDAWINDWVNNGEAGDLRRYPAHYVVTGMWWRHHTCIVSCDDKTVARITLRLSDNVR